MDRSMEKVLFGGRAVPATLANSARTLCRARVFFSGAMAARIAAAGSSRGCMVKASLIGQIANLSRASMKTTRSMALEFSHGPMVSIALASGNGKQHGIGTPVNCAGGARKGKWKNGNLEEWLDPPPEAGGGELSDKTVLSLAAPVAMNASTKSASNGVSIGNRNDIDSSANETEEKDEKDEKDVNDVAEGDLITDNNVLV